jgi:predicted permease
MKVAWRIYRRLAQAFPHEFKLAFGADMLLLGADSVNEIARRHGASGLFPLLADIAVRLPLEYLSEMRQDMRYAVRALLKSPGFALVGIVSMGLGIGLTTNIYSTKWALLTRQMPAAENASRLVIAEKPVSYEYIRRYREQKNLFAGVAALETGIPFNVAVQGHTDAYPERVFGQLVSPEYFSVLGVEAERGRVLSADVDRPGDAPVVVISDRFWRSRLNASPTAVGQTLHLNGQTATIVGITPRNFEGALAMNPSELFVPVTVPAAMSPELAGDVLHQRNAKDFLAVMAIAPGVTIDAAEAGLDTVTRRLEQEDGAGKDSAALVRANKAKRVVLIPAGTRAPIPRNLRPVIEGFFVVLMGLIMTIACMNLATMLLARGANRRKELAIRLGVGASRFRLIRQMISESILLSVLGGAAGYGLAWALSCAKTQIQQAAGAPIAPDVSMDWHGAVFAFAIAIVCGVVFSVAPALQATKSDVAPALKEGAALQLPGYRRFGLRNVAVVAQVTGSLMLLLITGFLVIGLSKGTNVETKFDQKTMVFVSIDPMRDSYTAQKSLALFERLPERLETSGGLASFALAAQPPYGNHDDESGNIQLTTESHGNSPPVEKAMAKETVGAGYFAVLNETPLAGREFTRRDEQIEAAGDLAAAEISPLVLNESAARGFFGDANVIGKRIQDDSHVYEVVGVVRDLKNGTGIRQAIAYLPLTQRDFVRPGALGITIVARSSSATDALSSVRGVMAAMDPNVTLFNVQTLSEYLEQSRNAMRVAMRTYGGIGLFGLILSAIGLAGVTAYAVAQRRKEIGIRMALGARKGQVLGLVLREGMALIAAGTGLGLLGAFALARILSSLTSEFADAFDVGTNEPWLLLGAPLLLAALAMLACFVPARAAARIDPLKALRQE